METGTDAPIESCTLAERDQKALFDVDAKAGELKSSLVDAAIEEAVAGARKTRIIMEIEKLQNEARKIITDGAKALGLDVSGPLRYDAKTFSVTIEK